MNVPTPSAEVAELLKDRYLRYNTPAFIEPDPICIPHSYTRREDIEIAGLLAATIAWGQRPTILRNARRLMALMEDAPYDFVMQATEADLLPLEAFVHRTFNGWDAQSFVKGLRHIYTRHGGLEAVFARNTESSTDLMPGLIAYHETMLAAPGFIPRTRKHVPDVRRGAAAKRLNMYLRWMVRRDSRGVDFGLWNSISPARLLLPLDLHTGRVARALGLLSRNQDDWRAVQALTGTLRTLDPQDPVKYDFALFGLGVYEGIR
ncbi:MAG: TIGR02757 family protein [Bacteroidetes bacterium]|nr:TIGR02757 family protein [Bacteroidota bacterium]